MPKAPPGAGDLGGTRHLDSCLRRNDISSPFIPLKCYKKDSVLLSRPRRLDDVRHEEGFSVFWPGEWESLVVGQNGLAGRIKPNCAAQLSGDIDQMD